MTRNSVRHDLAALLDRLDVSGRFALLKLATGALRIGISARLAKVAFAQAFGVSVDEIEEYWHGIEPPYAALFDWAARGAPLSQMPVIRAAHAEIAALLAIHPTPERCARLQALLEAHDAVEEGGGGAYADCEQLLGPDESVALGGRARAFGAVRVAKYRDLAPP